MDRNNFDGVRIGLALIVVLAHVGILSEMPEFSRFKYVFDSYFAVKAFFAISGFLVGRSYLSSLSLGDYAKKRVRRIFPGYLLTILFCIVIGAATTTIGTHEFLVSPQTLNYVVANLTLLNFLQSTLPGVFEGNPAPFMNGSLWTIKIEVMLYCCVPVLVYMFRKFGAAASTVTVYSASVAWAWYFEYAFPGRWGAEIARQFPGQLSYFVVGLLLAFEPPLLQRLKKVAFVSLIALFALQDWRIKLALDPVAYASIVLYLSIAAFRNLHVGRYGDISYGIYLFHYPIIQLLIHAGIFDYNAWCGLFLALVGTIAVAFASWHFVEKRFLRRA
jgi:peptidoglycan/LPS O-acetylase OafA/YrhL